MALLRDKNTGLPARDRQGNQTKTTTEGERNSRMMREARVKEKVRLRKANAKARAKRTPEEQLKVLDARLGDGVGAQRERARLSQQILTRIEAEKAAAEELLQQEAKEEQAKKARKSKENKQKSKRNK